MAGEARGGPRERSQGLRTAYSCYHRALKRHAYKVEVAVELKLCNTQR